MKKAICPAGALLLMCLAACGGGGSSADGPLVQPAAPTDRRVLLSQYKPATSAPSGPAVAQAAADYQFVTAPLLTSASEATVVVPAPALAQRALLIAAAPPGAQREELIGQPGDPRGLAAGVARRDLQSLAAFAAWPEWLQASALGSADAVAPAAWQVTPLENWDHAVGELPAGFSPSLRVVDSVARRWAWPGTVERFEGVFEFDGGARELRQMLRLNGPRWQLAMAGFSAQGLLLDGGVQLIKLRPTQGTMAAFARSPALGEALVSINQRLRAGLAVAAGSLVLGDQSPGLSDPQALADKQTVGSPETLPFTQLDGQGHYGELRRPGASLAWDGGGLQLAGSQELLFIGAGSNRAQSGGVIVRMLPDTPLFWQPPACPSAPVLRPELLLAVDAQFRLIWLARLPSQGSSPKPCL